MTTRRSIAALLLAGFLLAPVRAEAGYWKDAGIGAACVFVNLLYVPTKLAYATLGGVTGGLAFGLSGFDHDLAERIWTPSLGGDYVVARDHLTRRRTLYFSGVVQDDEWSAPVGSYPSDDAGYEPPAPGYDAPAY